MIAIASPALIPCVLYARFSPRPEGALLNCESLEVQIERMQLYCRMHGLDPIRVFEEPDVSARTTPLRERPQGRRLLELLAGKKVRHVVVQKHDRIFRDTADGLLTLRRWSKRKISLHLADQGGCSIDCSTATGEFLATMLLAQGTMEARTTSERTQTASLRHQANGRRMSRVPPFGMQLDHNSQPHKDSGLPSGLMPEPAEQAIIDTIQQLHAGGMGLREIARSLSEEGATCRGKAWHHDTIGSILRRAAASAAK